MCIISRWTNFSLGCRKTSPGDGPSFVPFCSAFIVDETSDIRLSMWWAVSKLRASNWLRSSKISDISPANFQGSGKNFKSLDPTAILCANFVAIRSGTAEIYCLKSQDLNQPIKTLLHSRLAGYALLYAGGSKNETSQSAAWLTNYTLSGSALVLKLYLSCV